MDKNQIREQYEKETPEIKRGMIHYADWLERKLADQLTEQGGDCKHEYLLENKNIWVCKLCKQPQY